MKNKLYVGNLSYSATEDTLAEIFSECGTVSSVKIIMDRDTGRSKGFGFVEMSNDTEAEEAISQLNGAEKDGRPLKVSLAKPQEKREGGGRQFGGGGGRRRY